MLPKFKAGDSKKRGLPDLNGHFKKLKQDTIIDATREKQQIIAKVSPPKPKPAAAPVLFTEFAPKRVPLSKKVQEEKSKEAPGMFELTRSKVRIEKRQQQMNIIKAGIKAYFSDNRKLDSMAHELIQEVIGTFIQTIEEKLSESKEEEIDTNCLFKLLQTI